MRRGSGDAWEIAEASSSAGILLDSMLLNHAARSFCLLQEVVNSWHLQAYVHVVIEPPSMLAITAGRFNVVDGRVTKSQHIILPDHSYVSEWRVCQHHLPAQFVYRAFG